MGAICANRLDPVAMKIINQYIPAANVPGSVWQGYVPSPYDTQAPMLGRPISGEPQFIMICPG